MSDTGARTADQWYQQAAEDFSAALARLARAYEADPDRSRDLLQEIHVALWRSFARFDGRCSLRTWVYRIAHNTAVSQTIRRRSGAPVLVSLEELAQVAEPRDREREVDESRALVRLVELIQTLTPIDRQVIVLYLEGETAAAIAEVTGLSPGNVATKTHRIKQMLVSRFHQGTHS